MRHQRLNAGRHQFCSRIAPTPTSRIAPQETGTGQKTKILEREQRIAIRPNLNPVQGRNRQRCTDFCFEQHLGRIEIKPFEPQRLERNWWFARAGRQQRHAFAALDGMGQRRPKLELPRVRFVQILEPDNERRERQQLRQNRIGHRTGLERFARLEPFQRSCRPEWNPVGTRHGPRQIRTNQVGWQGQAATTRTSSQTVCLKRLAQASLAV